MFLSRKYFSLTIGMILSLSLLVYACGGGGGGGTTTSPANGKSSSAATKSVVNTLGGATTATTAAKPSFKGEGEGGGAESDAALIRKGLEGLKAQLRSEGKRQKGLQATSTVDRSLDECDRGGSASMTIDDGNTPDNSSDDIFTTTYTNCRSSSGSGKEALKNGSEAVQFTATGITLTFTNLEGSEFITSLSSTNPIEYEKINGTFNISGGTLSTCAISQTEDEFFFSGATVTVNGTSEEKEDENADGTLEKHELSTSTNFTMTITETFTPAPACESTSTTIVLNGATAFEDKLNANSDDNYSASFTNYTMTLASATRGSVSGIEMTLDGEVTIDSNCADGTYTVRTTAVLFFPDDEDCPTEGTLEVTGGGTTATVVVNPDGSVDFDDDNDGVIENDHDGIAEPGEDKHFGSCDDSDICNA